MKKNNLFLIILIKFIFSNHAFPNDVSVAGLTYFESAAGRIGIDLLEYLKHSMKVNFIRYKNGMNSDRGISKQALNLITDFDNAKLGKVIFYIYPFCITGSFILPKSDNYINIAYAIFDITKVPKAWIKEFNKKCDLMVVPDESLIPIFKNSGVEIPIFVLSHGVHLNKLLVKPQKKRFNFQRPFIFGCASTFGHRKNHKLLVEAFHDEFGNSNKVKLVLHGFNMLDGSLEELKKLIKSYKTNNIVLEVGTFSDKKYIEFLNSLDCYVNLSKSEGYSVPPREVMALGVPCILSNNSAQKTLCNSGFVYPVKSEIREKAIYFPEIFGNDIGHWFNCSKTDVRVALRRVYNDYGYYFKLANEGRKWVKKFDWNDLIPYYMNLLKPKEVIMGQDNLITKNFLMVNSKTLFEKYKNLLKIK